MSKLKYCELFRNVQGEGIYTGEQNIFLRLSGCNKRCQWKNGSCDTKFASFQAYDFEDKEIEEIVKEIEELKCKNVIITGGEPLLQRIELIDLCKILKEKEYKLAIETNGSILPLGLFQYIDFFSISPKLPSSGNQDYNKDIITIKTIVHSLQENEIEYQLKFIIDTSDIQKEIEEVKNCLEKIDAPNNMNLIFNPEGLTEDLNEYANRIAKLAEYLCHDNYFDWLIKYKWRVMCQVHRVAWNNRRRM